MCTSPMMIPTYRYNSISSSSSPMPLDLNEDHHSYHHFFNITNQPSSSSSISYSTLFNQDQDQLGSSSYSQPITTPTTNQEVGNKFISWDHEEVEKDGSISEVKKVKDLNGKYEGEDISVKCMPLKMRIKRRMMVDQMDCEKNKFEKEKQLPLSPLGNTSSISSNNSSSNNNSNITVRVCTDCHTTKTPLWRSGPTGPKSLCNACGIRQRKARRALAATAAESGNDSRIVVKDNKLQSKGKKRSKTESAQAPKLKKKRKNGSKGTLSRNNISFDDLIISLSENLGCQQVFPQDEKEAAILLMALSHGFPQMVT